DRQTGGCHQMASPRVSALLALEDLVKFRPEALGWHFRYPQPRSLEDRRMAFELVRVVADCRALPWVAEFLDDEDTDIQVCGVGVLDQLLWSRLIEPEEAEDLLRMAERHQNGAVRERAEFIRSFLGARTGLAEQEAQPHQDET